MKRTIVIFATFVALSAMPRLGHAQAPQDTGGREAAFRAMTGPTREEVAGGPLLLGAYATVWALVFGYAFRIGRAQKKLAADVARLEARLAKHGDDSPRA